MSQTAQKLARVGRLIQSMISSSRTALLISGQKRVTAFPNGTGKSQMAHSGSLIAVFDTREQAEIAIYELQKARIDMSTIWMNTHGASTTPATESDDGVSLERLVGRFGAYCSTLLYS